MILLQNHAFFFKKDMIIFCCAYPSFLFLSSNDQYLLSNYNSYVQNLVTAWNLKVCHIRCNRVNYNFDTIIQFIPPLHFFYLFSMSLVCIPETNRYIAPVIPRYFFFQIKLFSSRDNTK